MASPLLDIDLVEALSPPVCMPHLARESISERPDE
jgi:hypothetical protein